jgi:hypothetical protein
MSALPLKHTMGDVYIDSLSNTELKEILLADGCSVGAINGLRKAERQIEIKRRRDVLKAEHQKVLDAESAERQKQIVKEQDNHKIQKAKQGLLFGLERQLQERRKKLQDFRTKISDEEYSAEVTGMDDGLWSVGHEIKWHAMDLMVADKEARVLCDLLRFIRKEMDPQQQSHTFIGLLNVFKEQAEDETKRLINWHYNFESMEDNAQVMAQQYKVKLMRYIAKNLRADMDGKQRCVSFCLM